MITLIAAVNRLGVIGRDGKLPWRNVEDLRFFTRETYGHPIIMGPATFRSLPKVLPGRKNIVVTRSFDVVAPDKMGVAYTNSLEAALSLARLENTGNIFIIGGAKIYEYALQCNIPDVALINYLDNNEPGDTFFPLNLLRNYYEIVEVVQHQTFEAVRYEKLP